jgi:hypothetical protein
MDSLAMDLDSRRHKVLTLLSHMRHQHRGDNRAMLSELADIAARMPKEDREQIMQMLVAEIEGVAEGRD